MSRTSWMVAYIFPKNNSKLEEKFKKTTIFET